MNRTHLFASFIALAPVLPALAGPLNTDFVPADSTWVLHFDTELYRTSTTGRFLMSQDVGLKIDDHSESLNEAFGFDFIKETNDFTAFGAGEEGATSVFNVSDVIHKVIVESEADESYERIEHQGIKLHSWKDDDGGEVLYLHVQPANGDRNLVVVGDRADAVANAVRTVNGIGKSIGDGESAFAPSPQRGSILYVESMRMSDLPDVDLHSLIESQTRGVRFEVLESEHLAEAQLDLETDSDFKAKAVSDALHGAVQLGRLIASYADEADHLNAMLNAISFRSDDDRTISARFQCPLSELEAALEHMEEHHHHDGDEGHHHDHDHDH